VEKYVAKASKKLDKRLAAAMAAYDEHSDEADELFHSARKAGKRARYAVELAAPLWGAKADKIVAGRKDLQDVLGEHQDSIVSADFLRAQGIRMGIRSGHNGFTYGLLFAREQVRRAAVGEQLKPFLS
jgi:CHAD domain-containing protein